jgi:hypothetical protein
MSMLKEHERTEVRSDRTRLRTFDCDVHPVPRQGLTSLTAYLPKACQGRFAHKEAMHDGERADQVQASERLRCAPGCKDSRPASLRMYRVEEIGSEVVLSL